MRENGIKYSSQLKPEKGEKEEKATKRNKEQVQWTENYYKHVRYSPSIQIITFNVN